MNTTTERARRMDPGTSVIVSTGKGKKRRMLTARIATPTSSYSDPAVVTLEGETIVLTDADRLHVLGHSETRSMLITGKPTPIKRTPPARPNVRGKGTPLRTPQKTTKHPEVKATYHITVEVIVTSNVPEEYVLDTIRENCPHREMATFGTFGARKGRTEVRGMVTMKTTGKIMQIERYP